MLPLYVIDCTACDVTTWQYRYMYMRLCERERRHSTLPVHVPVNSMSHEGSPVRREGSSTMERSYVMESSDQLAQLLKVVRRLQEGQDDATLKLERDVRCDPYLFKRHSNENQ